MATESVKFDSHERSLGSSVAELYKNPSRWSDVDVTVGETVFQCHKIILAMKSAYFQRLLFAASEAAVQQVTVHDIQPDIFKKMLRFIYTGEAELDTGSVCTVIRASKTFELGDLMHVCSQFARRTIDAENYTQYWKLAEEFNDSFLACKCFEFFARNSNVKGFDSSGLQSVTEDMMRTALEQDGLEVSGEVSVCEVLLRWFEENKNRGNPIHPLQLLACVRWSGVDAAYVKSRLMSSEILMKDKECYVFLSNVVSYQQGGAQFECLRTFHRPATGIEIRAMVIGPETDTSVTSDVFQVSLQRSDARRISGPPTQMSNGTVACSNNGGLYVTGIGKECKEAWRWDSIGGWTKCGDMTQRRRRHCATFVNNTSMYVLGGLDDVSYYNKSVTSSVELFSTINNKWASAGQLVNRVYDAGCLAHETCIYLFGGVDKVPGSPEEASAVDCIQVFDTVTKQCTVLGESLPSPQSQLRAVLWDSSAILINDVACLIFDFEDETVTERNQFAAGVSQFGLVLSNQRLFVIGGGKSDSASRGRSLTPTDEVKFIPVMDVVDECEAVNWTRHMSLSSPYLIHAFSVVTSPVDR
jgi:hypothetical protein